MGDLLPSRTSRRLRRFFEEDPFSQLQEELDHLLSRYSLDWGEEWLSRPVSPLIDLSETDDMVEVRMDMPGVTPEEIDVELTDNTLRITGEHKEEKEEKGRTYHRVERRSGTFSRSITLPCSVREEKIKAECRDGVLTITLPKTEESKPRKIAVKPNGN